MSITTDLTPAPYNPRKISSEQVERLRRAMAEYGDLSGIIKNARTGHLVGGHQRVNQFDPAWPIHAEPHTDAVGTVALGYVDTPWGRWSYREVDWPEEKEKAANIAANKHGGEWDDDLLKPLLRELTEIADFDISLTGFDSSELEKLLADLTGDQDGNGKSKREKNAPNSDLLSEEEKAMPLPDFINSHKQIIVSFSAGKDSVATALWALANCDKEKIRIVYCDTGIDWPHTHPYLDYLNKKLSVAIERIGCKNDELFREMLPKKGYPHFILLWCHKYLKTKFIDDYIKENNLKGNRTVQLIGARASESKRRAAYPDRGRWQDRTGNDYAHPILHLSDLDVCNMSRAAAISLNPVYLFFERTGCFCCPNLKQREWGVLRDYFPKLWSRSLDYLCLAESHEIWKPYFREVVKKVIATNHEPLNAPYKNYVTPEGLEILKAVYGRDYKI